MDPFSLDKIVNDLRNGTLSSKATARFTLMNNFELIEPAPSIEDYARPIVKFYLSCMKENKSGSGEHILEPYEAASELHRLFEHWIKIKRTPHVLELVELVTDSYLVGGKYLRNVIECGFLEHSFEIKSNRIFFDHWKENPVLSLAYSECSLWGDAHPR